MYLDMKCISLKIVFVLLGNIFAVPTSARKKHTMPEPC